MSQRLNVRHAQIKGVKVWLVAGLASVLAACALMEGGGSAASQWPTKADVVPAPAAGFTADGLAALDAKMKEAVDKGQVAGVEYVLFKDGKAAAFNAYGNQSLGGPPMTENTIFRVRSMSKPITGVAMMQLYEKGLWKPEDPVSKWFPELANLKVATSADNLDNLAPANHVPTMRELFTHTAGFGYGLSSATAVDRAFIDRSPMFEKDMPAMIKRVAEIPLLAQPGTRWSYSISIDIQGALVEKMSGMKFGDYLEKNIFGPLGMKDTGFWLTEADKPRFATVYQRNTESGKLEEFPDVAGRSFFVADHEESGGGGLVSTTHDYARFVEMLLNKGTLDGHQILKPETVDMMFTNQVPQGVNRKWGFGGSLSGPTSERSPQPENTFSWFGIDGTWFWADAKNKIGFVGMIQRRGGGGPGAVDFRGDSARLVYSALAK
jgi:CubicO group peptidase (beta-lactamase class C family)